ncbi:hypothetical protein ACT4UM_06470 [Bacillus sp. SS-TM]
MGVITASLGLSLTFGGDNSHSYFLF